MKFRRVAFVAAALCAVVGIVLQSSQARTTSDLRASTPPSPGQAGYVFPLKGAKHALALKLAAKDAPKFGKRVALPKKTIGIIASTGVPELARRVVGAANLAANQLGWNVVYIDAGGDASKMAAGVQSLVTQHVNAIVGLSIEPALIAQGLQVAHAANIPYINIASQVTANPDFAAQYAQPQGDMERALEKKMMDKLLPSGSKIAELTTPLLKVGFGPADQFFEQNAKAKGWNITADYQLNLATIVPDIQRAFNAAITSNPDLKAIWSDASSANYLGTPVLAQRGLCGKVLYFGRTADLPTLAQIRAGCVTAVTDYPVELLAWEAFDSLAEYFGHHRAIPTTPFALTKLYGKNFNAVRVISKASLPIPGAYPTQLNDWVSFFVKRWNIEFGTSATYGA